MAVPNALERKYLNAGKEWGPAMDVTGIESLPRAGTGEQRRHHLHESVMQKAMKEARLKAAGRQTGKLSYAAAFICHSSAGSDYESKRFRSC